MSIAALVAAAALVVDTVRVESASAVGGGVESASAVGVGVVAAAIISIAPLVVTALAALAAASRSPAFAGALTAGVGAVAVGLAVLDIGLLLDPIDANRLELFRPVTAAPLEPGPGAYLMLAAHVVAVLAGVWGWVAVGRASLTDGYGQSAGPDLTGRAAAARIGGVVSSVAAVAAALVAGSMFVPPYVSADSIVLVPAIIESPWTTAVGSGLVALAALVVTASALASISPAVASGTLIGAGATLLGLTGARVTAGLSSGAGIEVSPGAVVGVIASGVIVVAGVLALPLAAARDRRAARTSQDRVRSTAEAGSDVNAASTRWHLVAGSAGALAGVLLAAAGLLPVLSVPDGLSPPTVLATRTALIAGVVLVLASVPMFFSLFAATVAPALGVLSVAAFMAASGVLQSVVLASDIAGISVGTGGFATIAGSVAALVCGSAVLLAGSAERDDVDTSRRATDVVVGSVACVGAIVSAVGLALPLYRGVDVTAATVVELPWGWDVWGQIALAVTLLIGAVVAARSRRSRGTSLLVGAVVAMVIYLLGWPLTQARAVAPVVGPGLFAGVVGTVILVAAALLSARRQS